MLEFLESKRERYADLEHIIKEEAVKYTWIYSVLALILIVCLVEGELFNWKRSELRVQGVCVPSKVRRIASIHQT